ncbi:MAG: CDP-alcohol phosphatidyltransferase family protein, partial [Calditrichota bacterium]
GGILSTAVTAVLIGGYNASGMLLIALMFLAAILLDAVDGYLARRLNQQTAFGGMLDTEADGYAMLAGTLLACWQGLLSVEFMAAGLAYYLFVFAGMRRRSSGQELDDLIPGSFRRTMAGFMMGFIAAANFGIFSEHAVHSVGRIYLLFFIVLFIFDWLTVSGRIKEGGGLLLIVRTLLARGLFDMLPLVLRAALCFLIIIAFKGQDYYAVFLVLGLSITAGFLSRTLAVLLMLLLGWHLTISGSSPFADLALVYTATIALLGAGTFAIWQPEEKWINR